MSKISELRSLIGAVDGSLRRQHHSCRGLTPGIPQGAITQVMGARKTRFVVEFLAEHPHLRVAWLEEQFSLYPCALVQNFVSLERLLFLQCGEHGLWSLLQILRSGIFPLMVFSGSQLQEKALRRLQLACEKSQASLLWLAPNTAPSYWPVALRIHPRENL